MSELSIEVAGRNVVTVRVEPNRIFGRETAGRPWFYVPFQWQLLPSGQKGEINYAFIRLTGKLLHQSLGEFASFDLGPLAEGPHPNPYFRQQEALIPLDHRLIKRFEEVRQGKDAYFQIMLSGLIWFPAQQRFEVARPSGYLEVKIPHSHWAENVIASWNISSTRIVEIEFPKTAAGENFRAAYAKIENAQRLFASGHWKQTLGELFSAFEGLAKDFGFARPDQQFFAELLSGQPGSKKEKFKLAFDRYCDLLHLGRHEPNEGTQTFAVSFMDARFALTLAYAILEYITAPS